MALWPYSSHAFCPVSVSWQVLWQVRWVPPVRFTVANLLGAIVYVPAAVGVGYMVGYNFAEYLARFLMVGRRVEHVVLAVVLIGILAWSGWRFTRRGVTFRDRC